jgi:hypothetical protein
MKTSNRLRTKTSAPKTTASTARNHRQKSIRKKSLSTKMITSAYCPLSPTTTRATATKAEILLAHYRRRNVENKQPLIDSTQLLKDYLKDQMGGGIKALKSVIIQLI